MRERESSAGEDRATRVDGGCNGLVGGNPVGARPPLAFPERMPARNRAETQSPAPLGSGLIGSLGVAASHAPPGESTSISITSGGTSSPTRSRLVQSTSLGPRALAAAVASSAVASEVI